MTNLKPHKVTTISEFHKIKGLPKPEHPLVSVINVESLEHLPGKGTEIMILGFYLIALKRNCNIKFKYGQQEYDFDEGLMSFMSPNQVLGIEPTQNNSEKKSGWILLIHPDFLWNTTLAQKIQHYEFFDYSVHEALFLSEKEESNIMNIIQKIQQEYHANIDEFSQNIIIAQLEVLLNYAERYYQRQFITRKITNHQILDRLEGVLKDYFNNDDLAIKGLPTVHFIAEELNVSSNYLSGLLKVLSGQSTQQHIHDKLIEKAKEKLSTTDSSISEIAYGLGFEYPQSFSKLFKSKTKFSPKDFRQSINEWN